MEENRDDVPEPESAEPSPEETRAPEPGADAEPGEDRSSDVEEPGQDPEADVEVAPEPESDLEPELGSDTEPEPQSDEEPEPEAEPEAEPEPAPADVDGDGEAEEVAPSDDSTEVLPAVPPSPHEGPEESPEALTEVPAEEPAEADATVVLPAVGTVTRTPGAAAYARLQAEEVEATAAPPTAAPTSSPLDQFEAEPRRRPWRRNLAVAVSTVLVLGGAYVALLWTWADRVPPGTAVAGVEIGGLSADAAVAVLQESLRTAATEPFAVTAPSSKAAIVTSRPPPARAEGAPTAGALFPPSL